MFEILVLILLVTLIFFIKVFWLKVVVLILSFLLITPGFYAMITGAPFVLTKQKQLKAILKLGNFRSGDVVYELGCGDGRIIRAVAKQGVKKAVGYEFSIPTFLYAVLKSRGKEKIYFRNFWKEDYSDSSVLILFLLDNAMREFEKEIWPKLKKGTRVVSNSFLMSFDADESLDGVYLYIK